MSDGKEVRLNPELLTTKEYLYSEADRTWYAKVDEIHSEAGSRLSMGTASTANLTSNLTDTRSLGGVLTGLGTLTSAGMKFLLRDVIISATKKATVSLHDGTTCTGANKKFDAIVTSGTASHFENCKGALFSSAVRVKATTGDVFVSIGGLRLVLKV